MQSKTFKHRVTEVQALMAEEEVNLGGGEIAKKGMIIVIYPDGNRAAFSPEEFETLYEESVPHRWPGHINLANERGHFSGTYCITFGPAEPDELDRRVNDFFAKNQALLCAEVRTTPAEGNKLSLTIFYTRVVSQEDAEALAKWNGKAQELLDQEKAEMAEQRATFVEKAKKVAQERRDQEVAQREKDKELQALGEHCRKNHKKEGKKK